MTEVWLVTALIGEFDDRYIKHIGIFSSEDLANKAIEDFVKEVEKEKKSKFRLDYSEMPGYSKDSKEIWEEYEAWEKKHEEALEFRNCIFEKFELNKPFNHG